MKRWDRIAIVSALVGVVAVVFLYKHWFSNITLPTSSTEHMAAQASSKLPRLVDLGSTTCIPCKMMAPVLEELKKEYAGRMRVEFIDVNENPDAAKPFGIKLIPTQVFIDANGKELWRHEGFISKHDILGKWKELGVSFEQGQVTAEKTATSKSLTGE